MQHECRDCDRTSASSTRNSSSTGIHDCIYNHGKVLADMDMLDGSDEDSEFEFNMEDDD